jgi:hypothetical protein
MLHVAAHAAVEGSKMVANAIKEDGQHGHNNET